MYTGVREIILSDEEIAKFYEFKETPVELFENEYLLIKDKNNEYIDKFRFNGDKLVKLNYKRIQNTYVDKVKPLNVKQECVFDLLQNKKIKVKLITGDMGSGKAQPLNSKVLTPNGFVKMGDIKVGDLVYGCNGLPHKVLGVYPQGKKPVYEITFSDDSKVRCCKEHLWTYQHPSDKKKNIYRTSSLEQIMKKELYQLTNRNDKNWQFFIPLTKPIKFKKIEVNIDPYVLGVILGDGMLVGSNIMISNSEKDIIDKFQKRIGSDYELKQRNNNDYAIIYKPKYNQNPLKDELVKMGLYGKHSFDKFIPKEYLFNSVEVRVDLLKGLIDTDGSVRQSYYEYSTTSKQLANDVKFLVQSLGGTCKVKERQTYYTYNNKRNKGRKSYRLFIKTPFAIHSSKKHNEKYKKSKINPHRSIRKIEYVGEEECQCIYIDSKDHLYITDEFIVTHNTYLSVLHALDFIEKGKFNKLVYIRNNIEVAGVEKLGALPGDVREKLNPFIMPIADIVGSLLALESLERQEKIEYVHLGFVRGRDFSNSVVICSESGNLTKDHVKLLLGRVGQNSIIIFEGDTEQVDKNVYRENSGIQALRDILKGNPLFGAVELDKSERSDVADLSKLF